jgi:uncharacterized protein YkwD
MTLATLGAAGPPPAAVPAPVLSSGPRVLRRGAVVLLTLAVALVTLLFAPAAQAASGRLSEVDARMIQLVNAQRSAAGLPTLQSNAGLVNLSMYWSSQMADGATNYALQHNPNAFQQTLSFGASNRTAWGENVAKWSPTTTTADAIFDAYWNSPGHKANILGGSYRYVGIATVSGSNGIAWNTMTFTDKVDAGSGGVQWKKAGYSSTIWAVNGDIRHPATGEEWSAAGYPSPGATATEYVKYPWNTRIWAVTFWPVAWQWDSLDYGSWSMAGYPTARTAGWIEGSTVWKYSNSPNLYLTDPFNDTHQLTYDEWAATNFRSPSVR